MGRSLRSPGVYIEELSTFGSPVAAVPTSIPVFIGYTQNTTHEDTNLVNKAVRITSLNEFIEIFGGEFPQIEFDISMSSDDPDFTGADGFGYSLSEAGMFFRLFAAMKFFYSNGGSECYVLSIGDYSSSFDKSKFIGAIDLLVDEPDPSILVIPEAVITDKQSAYDIQNHMIMHSSDQKNKFAILDVPEGDQDLSNQPNCVENFRNGVGAVVPSSNSYAAAYYPWLHSNIYDLSQIDHRNISSDSHATIASLLTAEFTDANGNIDASIAQEISCYTNNGPSDDGTITLALADANFRNISVQYRMVLTSIQRKLNLMPPSSAIAGIYARVDAQRGVWKAPANVALQGVIAPAVQIDEAQQEDLNVPLNGKSICAIRSFSGRGILVWGARTLDSNSLDFRYVNVRRTLIFIEQSIKKALTEYVFKPNEANSWVHVNSMISNFLQGIWRDGGLAGATPEEAFSVRVGLGSTMTAEDILNGRMIVQVHVALMRPAEFIVITFEQQMQHS